MTTCDVPVFALHFAVGEGERQWTLEMENMWNQTTSWVGGNGQKDSSQESDQAGAFLQERPGPPVAPGQNVIMLVSWWKDNYETNISRKRNYSFTWIQSRF